MIVAGERFSSNACRLAEVARAAGCPHVQLVATADELDFDALADASSVGISAAASTPEETVEAIIAALAARFRLTVEERHQVSETMVFKPVRFG